MRNHRSSELDLHPRLERIISTTFMTYLIIFEVASAADVENLKQKLKSLKSFCPVTEHCWAIMSDDGASKIFDALAPAIKPTDRLFVIRSGTEAAWRNSFGQLHTDWLKKNL
jgi:hypothetical protein